MGMKYSVIIPVYNDPHLPDCLAALARLDQAAEIIVVENGTKTDWIEPLVKKYQSDYPWKYYYRTEAGSYAARNEGMHHASGNIFAFTDSDCVVAPDWLTMIGRILTDEQTDGVMGLAEGHAGNRVTAYEQRMYEEIISTFTQQKQLRRIDTRNFAMKRTVYDRTGDFASIRFVGDMEYGARAYEAGCTIIFSRAVRVQHQHISQLPHLLQKRVQQNIGNMELVKLHDQTFVRTYFPNLLRYQRSPLTWVYWLMFRAVYRCLQPCSQHILYLLPPTASYFFFKAANVLAIRLGQLTGIYTRQ